MSHFLLRYNTSIGRRSPYIKFLKHYFYIKNACVSYNYSCVTSILQGISATMSCFQSTSCSRIRKNLFSAWHLDKMKHRLPFSSMITLDLTIEEHSDGVEDSHSINIAQTYRLSPCSSFTQTPSKYNHCLIMTTCYTPFSSEYLIKPTPFFKSN